MLDAAEAAATLEVHYLVVHPGPESAIEPDATMANARRGRSYLRRISRRLTLSKQLRQ